MFRHISHASGVAEEQEEILFHTDFSYIFPDAANSADCLLPATKTTVDGLIALGTKMADPGTQASPAESFDGDVPAIFTYLGQFIDHDLTARTDRDTATSDLGMNALLKPEDPDEVIATLKNGRRPQFDLDSVFGDGPALVPGVTAKAQPLYDDDNDYTMRTFEDGGRFDLPRESNNRAIIADARNDENIVISQLHNAFIRFYSAVLAEQSGTPVERHIRARQLVRWAYQFVVVNDYLPKICHEAVVMDVLANGPRHLGQAAGKGDVSMPLEFSVAGFRFGHSMIRPFYDLNGTTRLDILEMLGTSGNAANFDGGQLRADLVLDWSNFVGNSAQKARLIDPKIAQGLFTLPFEGRDTDPVLAHLAKSNLLRAFSLSVPHGQAMASAFGLEPLTPTQIRSGEDTETVGILEEAKFDERSPLWFYVLKEAQVHTNGATLGAVGSRIVAETIINLIKQDPNGYLQNSDDTAVKKTFIDVKPGSGGQIRTLEDMLQFAGLL